MSYILEVAKQVQVTREQALSLVQILIDYELASACWGFTTGNPDLELASLLSCTPHQAMKEWEWKPETDFASVITTDPILVDEDELIKMLKAADFYLECDTVWECIAREADGEKDPWISSINARVDVKAALASLEPLIVCYLGSTPRERYRMDQARQAMK